MSTLEKLQEKVNPHKDELVLLGFKVLKLIGVIETPDDYYWVFDDCGKTILSPYVGSWIPLRGYIDDAHYKSLVTQWDTIENVKIQ